MPLAFARSILAGGVSKSLTLSKTASSINEGQSVTFNIQSVGIEGESIPYTVSGINSADLSSGSTSGNIGINVSGTGSVSFTLANDVTTEGTETLTLTLGSEYQDIADDAGYQQSVTVNDTSVAPSVSSVARSSSSVNEGSSVTFTVNTTNMTNGSRVYYRLTGIENADISSTSSTTGTRTYNGASISSEAGYITVNSSNQANLTLNMLADQLTEGTQTMYFRVTRLANSSGTTLVNNTSSNFVYVYDTSIAPPTGGYFLPATNNSNRSATYTIPNGVTAVSVMAVGGGGGGGTWVNSSRSGGGGGGGATGIIGYLEVVPGATYTLQAGGRGNIAAAGGASILKNPSGNWIMLCQGGANGSTSQGTNISSIQANGGDVVFYTYNAVGAISSTNSGYGGGNGGQGRNGWGGGGGGAGSVKLYQNTSYPTGGYVGQGAYAIGQSASPGYGGGGGGGYGAYSTATSGGQGGDIGFVAMPGPSITEGAAGTTAGANGGNGPGGSSSLSAQYGGGGRGGGGGTSSGSASNGEEGAIYLVHGGSNDAASSARKKWPDNPF